MYKDFYKKIEKNSLTILFDNAPSSHREGFIEKISKLSEYILFHIPLYGDNIHPSEIYNRNLDKDINRYKIDSSKTKDQAIHIINGIIKQKLEGKDISSLNIIHSFLDLKRLSIIYNIRNKFIKKGLSIKVVPYYEPIRIYDLLLLPRITRLYLNLIFQRIFFKSKTILVFSSLNKFVYEFIYKEIFVEPYSEKNIFIENCRQLIIDKKESREYRILFVGQLIKRKDPLIIIKAARQLNFNVKLTFIGEGPLLNDLKLEEKKPSINIINYNFLGNQNNSSILKIMKNNDVLVLPSLFDGFGFVVAEALYCGLYSIVSSKVGAKDIIDIGETGSVFKVRSSNDLVKKLASHYHLLKNNSLTK